MTWTSTGLNVDSSTCFGVTSSSDGTRAAAIFQGTDGYMYISSNGGATWTKETAAGKREWSSIVFSGDGKRLAAGVDGGYIYTRSF